MSAITTDGWGEQGGLVSTDGWGGQPEGQPALPSAYKPRIEDALELRPAVEGAEQELKLGQPAAKELRPQTVSQDASLIPRVADSSAPESIAPRLVGKEIKPR